MIIFNNLYFFDTIVVQRDIMQNHKLYDKIPLLIFTALLLSTNLWAKAKVNEEEKILEKLKNYPYLLAYADDKYKDDIKIVTLAIKKNGRILEYASKRLQDNEALVHEAVRSNGGALAYASERLRDDDDIVSMAIDSYGTYLQHASKRLQDDDDIVMDALRSNGANLQYASKRLRDDKWYVSLAVKNNSSALEYASKRLQSDRALVLLSVRTYSSNLSYASDILQDDKEIVLEAVRQDGKALRYASKRLKNDKEVVKIALKSDASNLAYASKAMQKLLGYKENGKIQIEFNEKIKNLESVPLGIKSTLALKSISLFHENKQGKSLIGQYAVSKDEPVDYYIALNLNDGIGEHNGSIVIELEALDGKKYFVKKKYVKIKGTKELCTKYSNKDTALNSFTEQKYKRHIMKLRIKDEVAYGAFMVMHPMLGKKDAKALDMKEDYIEHIVAKIGSNIVFELKTSSILRVDPFFRFTFNAPKKSGRLEIIVTDNQGKRKRFYKEYTI